ncbi:MAG: hypothetical protein ACOC41_05885 [Chitinivibrionales bacterium]
MKYLFWLILSVFLLIIACDLVDPESPNPDAVGTWVGALPDTTETIVFTEDRTVTGSYIDKVALLFMIFGSEPDDVNCSYDADNLYVTVSFPGGSSESLDFAYSVSNDTLIVVTSSGDEDRFRRK